MKGAVFHIYDLMNYIKVPWPAHWTLPAADTETKVPYVDNPEL